MKYSISICIPCYRDLEGLRATIASFVAALADVTSMRCEFAVGLNHCDFGKSDVMEPFDPPANFSFSIVATKGYLEYDESVKFAINQATGDICLLVGCGDIAKLGIDIAIKQFIDGGLKVGVLPVEQKPVNSPVDAMKGIWLEADTGFFNKVLSGHLFDRQVLLEAAKERLIGFEWAHVELAIRGAAISGGKTLVMSCPVIWRNAKNTGWWERAEIIKLYIEYCFLIDVYHSRFPDFAFPAAEKRKSGGFRLLLTILQARSNGLRELPSFLLIWQEQHKVTLMLKSLIKLSFMMPRLIVRICYTLLVILIKLRR